MSQQINKILFPTDLSRHARYAFNFASSIAAHYGASIAILHIVEEIPGQTENRIINLLGLERWAEIRENIEMEVRETLVGKKRDNVMIKQALDTFQQDASSEYPERPVVIDEIIVKEGNVADLIVKQVEASECDLIVMPYYARNMLAEAMMRGITRKVLRRSKTPVLLVPMTRENDVNG